jgi:hypothetical protein
MWVKEVIFVGKPLNKRARNRYKIKAAIWGEIGPMATVTPTEGRTAMQ